MCTGRAVGIVATFWMGLSLFFTLSAAAQSPVALNPVGAYIGAIQKQDFKTVIDLTYTYQQEVARIKAANPQVLWPKLTAEYYSTKESSFRQQAGYWQNYGETLRALMGDPAQAIRALRSVLPPSCRWRVTESRTDQVQDSVAFGRYQRTRVYVTIDYPAPADSPLVDQKLIKQTILEFTVNATSQLIMAATELPQGRVYWTAGPPDVHIAMAKRFVNSQLWDASIAELEPLERSGQLTTEGKRVLAQAYFQTAVQRCLPSHSGKEQECTPIVKRAATLDPTVSRMWAQSLFVLTRNSLDEWIRSPFPPRSKNLDYPLSLVTTASEFIGDAPQLRTLASTLRADIGRQYIAKAMDGYGFDAFGRVDGDAEAREAVSKAKQLYSDVLRDRQVFEAAKEKIRKAVAGFDSSIISQYEVTDGIGFLAAFQIPIPPEDLAEFRGWAKYTTEPRAAGGPPKWARAIEGLAGLPMAADTSATSTSQPSTSTPSANTGSDGQTFGTQSTGTGDPVSSLRSNIQFARTTAETMPLYNGDWRSVVTLTISNSLSAYNQLYLAAINRRSIALDKLAAADLFLSKGDTAHAKAYWQKAVYLTLDSETLVHAANNAYSQGVSNTAAVLNAVYRLSSESAGAVGYVACGTPCYDGIDAVSLLTDYAVDNAIQGKSEADQNLIKNGILKLILDGTGVQKLGTTQVTHFVGQPESVHVIVDKVLGQPQFKTQIMTLLGRTAGYASNSAISAAADSVWQALSTINRNCGNIQVLAPGHRE